MTERKKDLLWLGGLLAVLVLFFAKILFTDQIVRAPDIVAEFFWSIKHYRDMSFLDLFKLNLKAGWDYLANGGGTEGGGTVSMQFLYYRSFLLWLIPSPANIAWFMVLHLFFGGVGTYLFCRVIGVGRLGSFLAGLIFALAPENASLINAGHAQKIATISFAPWGFYFLEKGFQTRRFIYPLTTGLCLAFQFFNMHWQIAYYTCLGIGVYGVCRSIGILRAERKQMGTILPRILGLNLVTLLFFLSTVAISLVPLSDWSHDTTRGVQSGANQGKGGLDLEEAMSWSLPPEEVVTFVIPGFFGYSRQEGGYNGKNIDSYYWGRMNFTQTTDYMGLLPWLLVPLPLIFRRDKYTWLACAGIVVGILFSMGKFTPFYWFLYEHLPGINRFRVPKMIMFLPVMGLGVLAGRGIELLMDQEVRKSQGFRRYLIGLMALPLVLLALLGSQFALKEGWQTLFSEMLSAPNRYEQGPELFAQRWNNLMSETGIAVVVSAIYAAVLAICCRRVSLVRWLPVLLLLCYLADVGRVNTKYLLLQPVPELVRGVRTPTVEYLSSGVGTDYRALPMDGSDPMALVSNGIPVMFTSNPVQKRRWQEFLESFSLVSSMTDIMNVRYLVVTKEQYDQEQAALSQKYTPVFIPPGGATLVLENRSVLPKAWLAPIAVPVRSAQEALGALQDPAFNPSLMALVESEPPIPMLTPGQVPGSPGQVKVTRYEAGRIEVEAAVALNSMLVLGEKYYKGWRATVDGKETEIYPVNHVLRGIYLTPGSHRVKFVFDPMPFKIGKYLTLASFALFAAMLVREFLLRHKAPKA